MSTTNKPSSHNISAAQIHDEHQRRVLEAQAQGQTNEEALEQDNDKENEEESYSDSSETKKKRKRKEERLVQKIKQEKELKKRKLGKKGKVGKGGRDDDEDFTPNLMYEKVQKLPGQLEHCEICEKRFTVTPYSKNGPNGGLLCTKCSKAMKDEEKKAQPKKPRAPRGRRRQTESNRLDGQTQLGSRSLLEACVEKVADNINDVEAFGDLPQFLLGRLSQILSKKRVLTPRTLELFLQSELDSIAIYDCGRLEEEDFQKIFTFLHNLEDVNLRWAGQLKDPVLRYMTEHNRQIKHLQLGAANLVSNECWRHVFRALGPQLESLKISELNDSMDDKTLQELVSHCTQLTRIKLKKCFKLSGNAPLLLALLGKLRHLSLNVSYDAPPEILKDLVNTVGSNLQTLSLEGMYEADDSVLVAIHENCHQLKKLRFTDNSLCHDSAFTSLFEGWENPPLRFIDLSSNRDIDNANPDGPSDVPVGLASDGFQALMAHSGSNLERLSIASCRHINHESMSIVFDGKKQYPQLADMDISFLPTVDDFLVSSVFKSCPRLKRLVAFGCFRVKTVQIPKGVAVVGMSNAQDTMVVEGNFIGAL
ncbi:MAG: hypothetical protein Q9160_008259 [Pyrenula sp. 1 TL-2023]